MQKCTKKFYVLYHKNCFDGFGSAFCAWLYLGESAEYIPVAFGEPVPQIPDGSVVYILDFSFSRDILESMRERMEKIVVLDHHKTAEADLKGLPYCTFDMTKSGAKLSFEYFSTCDTDATDYIRERSVYVDFKLYTQFIDYISDRDLWENKLPDSTQVHAALSSYPKQFDIWFSIGRNVSELINEGIPILRHVNTTVSMMCDQSKFTRKFSKFGYKKVPVVNATGYWSEICHEMLARHPEYPFVTAYFDRADGKRQWSLRSRNNEDFDVSAIATKLGGGGHKHAAGFTEK